MHFPWRLPFLGLVIWERYFLPFHQLSRNKNAFLQGIKNSPGGQNSRGNQSKCSFAYLSFLHFLLLSRLETGKKYWLSVLSTAFYETQTKLISESVTQKCFVPEIRLSILGANLELGRKDEKREILNLPLPFASYCPEQISSLNLIFLIFKMGTLCFLDVKIHFFILARFFCSWLFEAGYFSPSVPSIPLICSSCKSASMERGSWVYIWQDESWEKGGWASGFF